MIICLARRVQYLEFQPAEFEIVFVVKQHRRRDRRAIVSGPGGRRRDVERKLRSIARGKEAV
ncbi:hypothetical protein D3C83_35100 [compost metagenome]